MKKFYALFPNTSALRSQLTWSSRQLERQIFLVLQFTNDRYPYPILLIPQFTNLIDNLIDKTRIITYNNITNTCKTTTKSIKGES